MERTLIFNKPYGVVSQFTPLGGHRTLAEFGFPKGVNPAGRLDHDSEGLLLLTGDGGLQHRLCEPRYAHPRTYLAQVERVPDTNALARLEKGLLLKDGPTKQCKAALVPDPNLPPRVPPVRYRKTVPTAWVELTLTEGRNRQVRRMMAEVGFPVLRLFRSAIGSITTAGLEPGQWRELSSAEIKTLSKNR